MNPQDGKGVTMSTAPASKTNPSQLVVLNKAFKLAEEWVKNMSPLDDKPSTEVKLEARPPRLGLGAKVPRQPKTGHFNDPVERKLHAMLDAGKRKAVKSMGGSAPSPKVGTDDHDDSDEELESRTKSFGKKKAVPPPTSSNLYKRKRK